MRRVFKRPVKKKNVEDTGSTLEMPDYKEVEQVRDPEEHERKMASISKRIDEVISSNSEEFVINFRQAEGE
jgi:hypothetical protein